MNIIALLSPLAIRIPLFLAWLVGIILAIVHWKRNPKVSMLALIAILLMACISISATIASSAVPFMAEQGSLPVARIGIFFVVINVITVLVDTIAWGLLLAAIFGWRQMPVETEAGLSEV